MLRTLTVLACLLVALSPAAHAAATQVACPSSIPLTMTLNYGDDANTNCQLTEVGQIAIFSFQGNTNDGITIAIHSSWNGGPCFGLYDPSGTEVGNDACGGGAAQVASYTLAMTGQYTIRVHDSGYTQIGGFGLMLENWYPGYTAVPLTLGLPSDGTTVNYETIDDWSFSAVAGSQFEVQVNSSYSDGPCYDIHGPAGVQVGANCGGGTRQEGQYTSPATGTYIVSISSAVNSEKGTYAVIVQCLLECQTISASPSPVNFGSYAMGQAAPQSQQISVTSGDPSSGVSFTVTDTPIAPTADCNWLTLGTPSGSTPATVAASLNTSALTTTGSYSCTVTVTASGGSPTTSTIAEVQVVNGPAITGPSSPLPAATVGVAYSPVTFTASGGTGGYTWSVSPALPSGLSLSSGGVLSGMLASGSQGTYTLNITVTDSNNDKASGSFSLTVNSPPAALTITGPSSPLPSGTVGTAYVPVTFTATGGTGGYTWSMSALPASPAGLSLSSDGSLSGTPSSGSQGAYSLTVTVKDSSGATASAPYTLTIAASTLVITSPSSPLPSGTVSATYGPVTFTASGGTGGYTWSVSPALPSGLSLSSGGVLSGTPASGSQGPYTLDVTVTDSSHTPASKSYSLTINPSSPISITGPACPLPSGNVGQAYGPVTFTVSGGSGSYGWTETGAPSGLSLSSGGVLSGTPASGRQGSYTLSVTVTDSSADKASEQCGLTINSSPTSWDPAADFEAGFLSNSNPNGVWSYGYSADFTAPITLYTQAEQQAVGSNGELQQWVSPSITIGGSPTVLYNDGPAHNDGNTDYPADGLVLVAGIGGQYTDLVFAAPVSGSYSIVATFRGDQYGVGTLVAIVVNGNKVFSSTVTSDAQLVPPTPFSAEAQLNAGDTIVFSVGPGGGLQNTGLAATISFGSLPDLAAAPNALTFTETQGGSSPAAQTIAVSSTGAALPFTATATASGGSWLAVSPASGITPANLAVSINTISLTVGTYQGQIAISGTGAGNSPIIVPVTLNVTPPPPVITSLSPSSATAGGPPFTLTVNGSGFVSSSIVLWNTSALVTKYVSASQLTATVTSGLIGTAGTATVTMENLGGLTSNPVQFPVNPQPTTQIFTSPASLTFTYAGGNTPPAQTFSVFSNGAPVKYSMNVSYPANGPTNWLGLGPSGQTPSNAMVGVQNLANVPTCAGPAVCSYSATINIVGVGVKQPAALPVTLTIIPEAAQLSVSPPYVTASAVSGAAAVQQQVQVFNVGGGTLNYTVATPTASWLTISCGMSGSVAASASTPVCLTLNPGSLQQGNYHTLVTISAGNQSANVNVTLQVAAADPLILLSPNAMQFTAVSGGATPSPQSLTIFNIGTGTLDWTAQPTSTHNWLQVSAANGCAGAGQIATGAAVSGGSPSTLTVCVDLAQAAAGQNFGQIAVSSESSANSEAITVLLNVLPGGSALPELASPTGVTLQTTAGSSTLPSSVTLSNPNGTPVSFNAIAVELSGGPNWLIVTPTSGSVPGDGSTTVQVQGAASSLTAGTYDGQMRIGFGDGTSQVVNVIFNVNPASGQARREQRRSVLSDCPGGYVLPPQFVNLTQSGFQVPAGDVQLLQVTVKDSCGNAITPTDQGATLSVVIYNKDSGGTLETPNLLYSSTDSAWEYSWTPTAAEVGPVGMYAIAGVGTGDNSIGNRSDIWTGSVTSAALGSGAEPVAVANAASVNLDQIVEVNQVAAGSYITIYGTLLADGIAAAYPFPTQEEGSTVELGGVPLRLYYVSPTQVNALVPLQANLPMNAPLPLKIQRDETWSVNDLQVSVTNLQPAIYVLNANAQGAALIANTTDIVAPVGTYTGSRPAQAGVDYIEIYCNGLGPVSNPPVDGQPAQGNPLSATATLPQVTIGGIEVPAYWAGLSPGSVALYQVDVQVPAGSQTGGAVPLTIQMGNVVSNTVYIAVQ